MQEQNGAERGSAVAEFVMVSALLIFLFLACLQVAFALHVRNTVQDAASTGARYGTLRDRSAADGAARTREILTSHLGQEYAEQVSTEVVDEGSHRALVVRVAAPLPVLGPWGVGHGLEVSGHAVVPEG